MSDYQVKCINKPHRDSKHEHITHLGDPTFKPNGWRLTREDVINHIESKTHTFFTLENGTRANIGVVDGQSGKYLRTYADGKWKDNLLSLPECG